MSTTVVAACIAKFNTWMFDQFDIGEDRGFIVIGTHGEHFNALSEMYNPSIGPGDYVIKWPNGMVSFRKEESFMRDFQHLYNNVYKTECRALFS